MSRIRLVCLIISVIIIVTSIFLIITHSSDSLQHHSLLDVNREVEGFSEEQTLKVAETIDYATITGFRRFEGSSETDAFIHPESYLEYTWANFIDTEVIDYYQNRYDYQQKQKSPKGVTFTYNAKVTYLEQLQISNITTMEQHTATQSMEDGTFQDGTITYNRITIGFYDLDKTTPFKTINQCSTYHKNHNTFYKMPSEFNLAFNNCYIVEMNLTYEEYYNPLAAFFVRVQQIIVLDQNFDPLWIGITPPLYVVA